MFGTNKLEFVNFSLNGVGENLILFKWGAGDFSSGGA